MVFFAALSRHSRRRPHRRGSVIQRAVVTAEQLENRRLMAVAVNVNFQPASAAVPAGYLADSGLTYGDRGNGYSYGWNAANNNETRDRNVTSDQKFDTLIHTSSKSWEIAVPNGTYNLRLVAGDPSYFDSSYAFDAEGALALRGTPSSDNRFIIATRTVTVADGRLTLTDAAGSENNKLAFLEITDAPADSLPSVPATIQAENFDDGGQNVSYFDTTTGNAGGKYRSSDVDIIAASEGGYAIGFTRPGEWLMYTFNAPAAGTFDVDVRVACGNAGGVFHLEIDGVDKTGAINLANTGGWQQWKTLTKSGVAIGGGQHTMRLAFDRSNGGDIGDINWIKFRAATTTPTVSVAATDSSASEPGTNTGKFTITRTGSTSASLLVNYVIGGSATNGSDYNSLAGSVTIPAGSSSATVTVTPKDDATVENTETVTLTLSPVAGHNLGTASATVTIADNDTPTTSGAWPKSWSAKQALPRPRHEARGAAMDGKVWVFGGFYSNSINATQEVDFYDIATNTWGKLADYGPMPHTHSTVATDPANHAIYFIGGLYGDFPSTPTNRIFKFNTLTRTWSEPLPKLPVIYHSGGAAIVNGILHFFGGSEQDRVTDTGRHLVLNLSTPA
ncbi:MAG: hypothetical protein QOF78_2719, partial [Phycisphaerales bacterium]|nr:hypothetical protein [Phycisphaerales bacterium]